MFDDKGRSMTRVRAAIATGVLIATCGTSLTACGQASSNASATTTVTVTANPTRGASGHQAKPATVKPTAVGDLRACDAMQTVMARMTTAAAGWRPATKPFDQRLARKIRLLSQDMASAERQTATPRVRLGVHLNTVAFTSLAQAMSGSKKATVYDAVGKTQVAYGELKSVCALG
ncbi:MAG: hypothetical protein ABI873_07810 [Marmoricola sp.]